MERCPYCNEEIEIDHDEGYGYEEGEIYEQECDCGKTFTYSTSVHYHYELAKAPCKNGEDHKLTEIHRIPKELAVGRMVCVYCDEEIIVNQSASDKARKDYWDKITNE